MPSIAVGLRETPDDDPRSDRIYAARCAGFGASALRLAPALFAVALFLSALLLFLVQPMFTKMVLPRLGGAPTVWSVAMVFQGALLAGYAYAQLLVRRFPLGHGALIHLGVLAAAALTLPIGIADTFGTRPGWRKIEPDPAVAAWTDDYSDIFGAILRKKLGW